MTSKEQFIKLPRELLESDALRSLSPSSFRLVHFLMIEYLRNGGRENGYLKAPHRQLIEFGIGAQYVSSAIDEAEQRGLIECHRQGLRIATTYALTWLPLHDRSQPSNAWRDYRTPEDLPENLPYKDKADGPKLPYKR